MRLPLNWEFKWTSPAFSFLFLTLSLDGLFGINYQAFSWRDEPVPILLKSSKFGNARVGPSRRILRHFNLSVAVEIHFSKPIWNVHVSPGQPVYERSDKGEQLIELCTGEGTTPKAQMHQKEVFL